MLLLVCISNKYTLIASDLGPNGRAEGTRGSTLDQQSVAITVFPKKYLLIATDLGPSGRPEGARGSHLDQQSIANSVCFQEMYANSITTELLKNSCCSAVSSHQRGLPMITCFPSKTIAAARTFCTSFPGSKLQPHGGIMGTLGNLRGSLARTTDPGSMQDTAGKQHVLRLPSM